MTDPAEHAARDGAAPNDGPLSGAPGPSAETDRAADAPSGLPDEGADDQPLGTTEEAPEGDAETRRGAEDMPGIPTGGEPPVSG